MTADETRVDERARRKTAERLATDMGRCIEEHRLIEAGDRILVCLSGGKDSYTMLHLLAQAQRRAPIPFTLVPYHLDQKQPGYDGSPLRTWLAAHGFDVVWDEEDTYRVVKAKVPEGKSYCSVCSRLRRGIIYNVATRLGCTKIALGHHRDDAIETLLLNQFFAGSMAGMPARWSTKDGRNTVIRPLLYASEEDIAAFAQHEQFPILPCNLCGSQENLKRQWVKSLLTSIEAKVPHVRRSLFAATKHIKPKHLLDPRLLVKATQHEASLSGKENPALNDELSHLFDNFVVDRSSRLRESEVPRPRDGSEENVAGKHNATHNATQRKVQLPLFEGG